MGSGNVVAVAAILFVPLLIGAMWLSVYEVGLPPRALGAIASAVPLPAGSVDGELVYADELAARALGMAMAGGGAASAADTFAGLRDELLVRHELARRDTPVSDGEVEQALAASAAELGPGSPSDIAEQRYGWNVARYREVIVRPQLERARLAAALVADRSFSTTAWEEAERTAALTGEVGLEDLGWLTANDLSAETERAIATLPIGQRSAPLATSGGLVVMLVSDRLTDDDGIQHWRLWRRYVPVDAVETYLEQARLRAAIRYFLPR